LLCQSQAWKKEEGSYNDFSFCTSNSFIYMYQGFACTLVDSLCFYAAAIDSVVNLLLTGFSCTLAMCRQRFGKK